jgi:hypothetical protein
VAEDLDRRAREHRVGEADVRFGDLDADSLYRGMILKYCRRYPLGDRLGQLDGLPLDDLPSPPMNLAVVYGLRQVVGEASGTKVQTQLDINDEGLAQLELGGERAVTPVEDHALEQYPVLCVFLAPGHPMQYRGP